MVLPTDWLTEFTVSGELFGPCLEVGCALFTVFGVISGFWDVSLGDVAWFDLESYIITTKLWYK